MYYKGKNKKPWKIFSLISLTTLLLSCTHDPLLIDELDEVCYETQVKPILLNSCGVSGCHDTYSSEEGFNAHDLQSIMQLVEPGEPRKSKLYTVLTDLWGEHFMPPDNPLSAKERNIIQIWIAQGANTEDCSTNNGGTGDNPDEPPVKSDTVCFVQDILPVFMSGCGTSGCHDETTRADGYVLTNYSNIMSGEEGIVPYNPESSEIYEKITTSESDERMPPPPRSPLPADQINAIRTWIENGALNSDCPDANCDTLSEISFLSQITPIIESNCLSCHNSTQASGGIQLNNYTNIKSSVDENRNGTPLLLGAIRRENNFSAMPPSFSLDDCDQRIFELWVEQGMPNN